MTAMYSRTQACKLRGGCPASQQVQQVLIELHFTVHKIPCSKRCSYSLFVI